MLSPETLKKIQQLHFKTRHMANEVFAGQYSSAFKGQGMEFAEVREYQVGDDIRSIDWNVSARYGHPFVKLYHEEREMTVMLLLDLSASHNFGTRKQFKREQLAEVAGMLAYLAIRTNDKVGALLFAGGVEKYLPPRKGPKHVWRLIREIFTHEPQTSGTNIEAALSYLNRVVKRHAIVFLISDCRDEGYEKALQITARKHDLTVIRISDPAELDLPDVGLMAVSDPETGRQSVINTRRLRKRWRDEQLAWEKRINETLLRAGAERVDLSTQSDVVEPLTRYFERRRMRGA